MDLNTLDRSQLIDEIHLLRTQMGQLKSEQYSSEFFASTLEHMLIPVAILEMLQGK